METFQFDWYFLAHRAQIVAKGNYPYRKKTKRNRKIQFQVEMKNRQRRNKTEKNKTKVYTFMLCCRRTRFFCKNISRMIAEKMLQELPRFNLSENMDF